MPFLLHAPQVDAVGQLGDQLVEQVNRDVAIALQILNRGLTGTKGRDLPLQVGNVLDLEVQLGNLTLQKRIAILLRIDLALVPGEHGAADDPPQQGGPRQLGEELLLLPLARRLTVGQQVDQNHW